MPVNWSPSEHSGPCPQCGTVVPTLAAVLTNVDASYLAIHTTYVSQDRVALHLASNTLHSTAAALRCLLGACRPTGG